MNSNKPSEEGEHKVNKYKEAIVAAAQARQVSVSGNGSWQMLTENMQDYQIQHMSAGVGAAMAVLNPTIPNEREALDSIPFASVLLGLLPDGRKLIVFNSLVDNEIVWVCVGSSKVISTDDLVQQGIHYGFYTWTVIHLGDS